MPRIYRSQTHRMLGGVLGGIGEAVGISPTLLRVAAVVLALMTGVLPMVVLYLLAWALLPERATVPAAT